MASRYYVISVTVPVGTTALAPQTTVWPLERVNLVRIELDVPDGHNSQTGIRLLRSQQQVIPWSNNQYLVTNDRKLTIDVGEELTEGQLVIQTINNDIFVHTFYLRATVSDLALPSGSGTLPPPIVASALLASPGVPSL